MENHGRGDIFERNIVFFVGKAMKTLKNGRRSCTIYSGFILTKNEGGIFNV